MQFAGQLAALLILDDDQRFGQAPVLGPRLRQRGGQGIDARADLGEFRPAACRHLNCEVALLHLGKGRFQSADRRQGLANGKACQHEDRSEQDEAANRRDSQGFEDLGDLVARVGDDHQVAIGNAGNGDGNAQFGRAAYQQTADNGAEVLGRPLWLSGRMTGRRDGEAVVPAIELDANVTDAGQSLDQASQIALGVAGGLHVVQGAIDRLARQPQDALAFGRDARPST